MSDTNEEHDNGHSTALAVAEPRTAVTAAQAKVDAVANLTLAAYAKASQLALTDAEIAALQADFPDEAFRPGAAGKESLIYIEHAHLRDRMNQVFGPGQWSIIPRSRWGEDFTTNNGDPATRVYVEAMLLIRGCFVAEAIGDMTYYPHNQQTNYGDAVEGAKSACLRRCAKELGVGLQAWKKGWCEGWWARSRAATKPAAKPQAKPAAPPAPKEDKKLTEINTTTDLLRLKKAKEWALKQPVDTGKPYLDAIRERAGWLFLAACNECKTPEAACAVEDGMLDPFWELRDTHWDRDVRAALKVTRATFPKQPA